MTYHRVCSISNMSGVISGAGAAFPPRAPDFYIRFYWVRVAQSLLVCRFCRPFASPFELFIWPLYCMSFDLRFLIILVIYSNVPCTLYLRLETKPYTSTM